MLEGGGRRFYTYSIPVQYTVFNGDVETTSPYVVLYTVVYMLIGTFYDKTRLVRYKIK